MALDKYTIGRRYGKALFELAEENDTLESTFEELMALRHVFEDNAELGDILTDTRLNLTEKKPIIDGLKANFSPSIQAFLQMVFEYKRMSDILFIVDHFEALYDEKKKIILAEVTTAIALTDAQQEKLSQQIAKRFEANEVKIDSVVDPAIIGGVIVKTADKVVDGSLRTKLANIESLLLNK
ncbi:ATP synthase F1 subunit delta [Agrilactobacillus yilanensis]|uniref:ATP synthase subunit delta n=1 Tax=Agrilactobacillus yilanensis TaxID=2485997 RepID=A0ABW4J4D9_9LACO|nr:ATP synthase F1 subunit delta [Agrilactobacillus yilanensis]